jgi:hypothetical protein
VRSFSPGVSTSTESPPAFQPSFELISGRLKLNSAEPSAL